MIKEDFSDLRAEFDKFVHEKCGIDGEERDPDAGDKVDDEPVPQFVDALTSNLLAPSISGIYLSRLDIKRVAENIDESIPIKERVKMVRALFRHTTKKEYLESAFKEINTHIQARISLYTELGDSFPSSKYIFDENIAKAKKMSRMFEQIIEDFEEIEPTDDPLMI